MLNFHKARSEVATDVSTGGSLRGHLICAVFGGPDAEAKRERSVQGLELELKSALSFQNDQSLHETNTNLGRRLRWLHSQPSPISV